MEYIFYSHFVAIILKGKSKFLQIAVSVLVLLFVLAAHFHGIVTSFAGKTESFVDVLFVLLLIYSIMNLVYASFNIYAPVATAAPSDSAKVENISVEQKTEIKNGENKIRSNSIKSVRNISSEEDAKINLQRESGIKRSPKTANQKLSETIIQDKAKIKSETVNSDLEVPPLESTAEKDMVFHEKEREEFRSYSGNFVGNPTYVSDISDVADIKEETPKQEETHVVDSEIWNFTEKFIKK